MRLRFKPSLIKELGGYSGRAVHLEHQCLSSALKSSSLHQNLMGYSFTQTPPPHQVSWNFVKQILNNFTQRQRNINNESIGCQCSVLDSFHDINPPPMFNVPLSSPPPSLQLVVILMLTQNGWEDDLDLKFRGYVRSVYLVSPPRIIFTSLQD